LKYQIDNEFIQAILPAEFQYSSNEDKIKMTSYIDSIPDNIKRISLRNRVYGVTKSQAQGIPAGSVKIPISI